MNNGWMGKGDGVGGGSRGRGRGRGDLTRVKPLKPAKEVSDEKRSRGEVALFRVIKSKMEEEMEKEDKVEEELLVKNTPPLSKFAHIYFLIFSVGVKRAWIFFSSPVLPGELLRSSTTSAFWLKIFLC